jgi:hypothetical protein
MDKSQPGVTTMLQVEAARSGPSPVRTETATPITDTAQPDATVSLPTRSGRPGKNVIEASSVTVVMGQTFASVLSAPPTIGEAIPEEVAPMEGSAPLEAHVGSSQALVCAGGDLHMWEGPAL